MAKAKRAAAGKSKPKPAAKVKRSPPAKAKPSPPAKAKATPAAKAKASPPAKAKSSPAAAASRIPKGQRSVTPHLVVREAAQAIEFYKKAFGAEEIRRAPGPDGKIMHAEMQLGDSHVYLNDEFPAMGALSPLSLNGTPVTIHLWFEDVDEAYRRALEAGARMVMPLADQFWGDRYGIVADPFGHHWSMASHVRDVTPEEMAKAMEAMSSQPPAAEAGAPA
jgi:PhnB protein